VSRLAIVTGGSTGIGRHLVEHLSGAGYAVAFSYVGDAKPAAELERQLTREGREARGVACDAGMKAEVDGFLAEASHWHGAAPRLLVNNAGIQRWNSLLETTEDEWDAVIRTNLKGCFLHTQEAARRMVEGGQGGTIVNIGSGCNKLAFPNLVSYTVSKGGIELFTKSAAVELGRFGITVNCVAPGAIATQRTLEETPDYAASWEPLTPFGRIGAPEDIAGVVAFFDTPAARFVTGQTIWVDGGLFTRAAWAYPQ
jgi:3-oxoacyl-[acyl-carrier protein] reductase